jgi:hypothetical protein
MLTSTKPGAQLIPFWAFTKLKGASGCDASPNIFPKNTIDFIHYFQHICKT